jgi:excisionase family DNA binding protein
MTTTNSSTLSAQEVADHLGVSAWSVRESVRRGEIPNVGLGKTVRISVVWLERHLKGVDAGGISRQTGRYRSRVWR